MALLSEIIHFIIHMDGDGNPIETLTPEAIEELNFLTLVSELRKASLREEDLHILYSI